MKFDFIIGNPPYQDETVGEQKNYAAPIYHLFLDNAYEIADKVEMIHPARFLFNAGSTPKSWNQKMLQDEHLKVVYYEANSGNIFPNTDIKGGIAITYRDREKIFEKIGHFVVFEELHSIVNKVNTTETNNLGNLIYAPESYKFNDKMHEDYPKIEKMLSKGHKYDFKTNVFEKLDGIVFFDCKPQDDEEYVKIVGLVKGKRVIKWIRRCYIKEAENFKGYKVFIPEANGSGTLGEVLSNPVVIEPFIGHTQTFISMGNFAIEEEAKALLKYVKTKFCRVLLGSLKITQHNSKAAWRNIPNQDFTSSSDIDWSKSIKEIDRQLYDKYGLDENEVNFIESHVKEME